MAERSSNSESHTSPETLIATGNSTSSERQVDSDELEFHNSIPPDALTATMDWDPFVANTTRRLSGAQRFFWWNKYWDYGTGISVGLFVYLFSACIPCSIRKGRTGWWPPAAGAIRTASRT